MRARSPGCRAAQLWPGPRCMLPRDDAEEEEEGRALTADDARRAGAARRGAEDDAARPLVAGLASRPSIAVAAEDTIRRSAALRGTYPGAPSRKHKQSEREVQQVV